MNRKNQKNFCAVNDTSSLYAELFSCYMDSLSLNQAHTGSSTKFDFVERSKLMRWWFVWDNTHMKSKKNVVQNWPRIISQSSSIVFVLLSARARRALDRLKSNKLHNFAELQQTFIVACTHTRERWGEKFAFIDGSITRHGNNGN